MNSDDLMAMHKVTTDVIESMDDIAVNTPREIAELAVTTAVRNLAVVQRDLLAAMLGV